MSAPTGDTATAGRSRELFERACALIPGGVNSPVRAMGQIGRTPPFIARGEGPYIEDVDGNRYIDWVCSWGPLIAGHRHPQVVGAVEAALERGVGFGAPTELEVELAAAVLGRFIPAQRLRLVCSGTEAAMTALRLARAHTGRDRVIKFAGAYHGHLDQLLVEAGSGLASGGLPASAGVGAAVAAQTVVVGWNDPDGLREAFATAPPAALILEPLPANMGVVAARPGFLELARELCDQSGAVLIADEVISGFRLPPGCAQRRYGLRADLTVLGKVLGGGLPVGGVAGPAEILDRLAPLGDVYQAGTLAGNPLAAAAGLATLGLLDPAAYDRLEALTGELAAGLQRLAADFPVSVAWQPGLLTVFFRPEPPADYAEARTADLGAFARFCCAMLEAGIYIPPSQFEAWFPSLAHTPQEVERTVEAAAGALERAFRPGRADG